MTTITANSGNRVNIVAYLARNPAALDNSPRHQAKWRPLTPLIGQSPLNMAEIDAIRIKPSQTIKKRHATRPYEG
ncbi:MAG: hypothetical protein OQL08_03540 [Gammaproteobacteria bacterium]|nr:hypothetical protein [Gammaproteobacteria bacterium]